MSYSVLQQQQVFQPIYLFIKTSLIGLYSHFYLHLKFSKRTLTSFKKLLLFFFLSLLNLISQKHAACYEKTSKPFTLKTFLGQIACSYSSVSSISVPTSEPPFSKIPFTLHNKRHHVTYVYVERELLP